jgi:hypothetical protein
VPGRIQESIGCVAAECEIRIVVDRKTPEISILEDKKKESLKNIKEADALGFIPARSKKSGGERNKFGECEEAGRDMDGLILLS